MFDWLRRRLCRHTGLQHLLYHGEIAGVSFTLWRCADCGTDIFHTDD